VALSQRSKRCATQKQDEFDFATAVKALGDPKARIKFGFIAAPKALRHPRVTGERG
jgi:hypothetical protein